MYRHYANRVSFNIIIPIYKDNVSFRIEVYYNDPHPKSLYPVKNFQYSVIIYTTILNEEFTECSNDLTGTITYEELIDIAKRIARDWYVQEYHRRLMNIHYPKFLKNLTIKPNRYEFIIGTLWYDEYDIKFSLDSGILFKGDKILGEIKGDITNPSFMIKRLEKLIKQEAIETWKSELRYKIGIEKYETNKQTF